MRLLSSHSRIGSIDDETGIFTGRDIYHLSFSGVDEALIDDMFNDSNSLTQFYDRLAVNLLSGLGKKRFLEKTPQHIFHIGFIRTHFPNAKIINIYRDGRDCYCSSLSHPNVIQNTSLQRFARYWRRCIQARMKYGPCDYIYDLKYEDLVSCPEGELKKIMKFLEENYETRQTDPLSYTSKNVAKPDKFSENLSKPITSRSVGRWKKELTGKQIIKFNRIARQQLMDVGYSL